MAKNKPGSRLPYFEEAMSQFVSDGTKNSRRKTTVTPGDNPRWKCENCGSKGAMDYAGQGRVCQSCAKELGF